MEAMSSIAIISALAFAIREVKQHVYYPGPRGFS